MNDCQHQKAFLDRMAPTYVRYVIDLKLLYIIIQIKLPITAKEDEKSNYYFNQGKLLFNFKKED